MITHTSRGSRPPAVAGLFYPGAAAELRAAVEEMLAQAVVPEGAMPGPQEWIKALIVPHAGYIYSGPIAAVGYRALIDAGEAAQVRRVVLLGPAHREWVRGLALPSPGTAALRTPLGEVPVDREAVAAIADLPQVVADDRVHAQEHSLEVHLPFLQVCLPAGFHVLPLCVGEAGAEEVAGVLSRVYGGAETLIVASSDLSHYHPYDVAARLDHDTAEQIVRREIAIDHQRACGATPVSGLLALARERDLDVRLLDLRSSGDTAGDRRRVVGYGAFLVLEKKTS